MSLNTTRSESDRGAPSTISAAYSDPGVARRVIGDLERAGMGGATIRLMTPWPSEISKTSRFGFLDHSDLDRSRWSTLIGAVLLATIASLVTVIWANADSWLVSGALGALVGALSGAVAGAIGASGPPHWDESLLGDPIGAVTVEVEATEATSAEVARVVMAGHEPALMQSQSRPAPRPASERVLWEHEDGASPLAELRSWIDSRPPTRIVRQRHRRPASRG